MNQAAFVLLQQAAGGGVRHLDAPVESGGDDASVDGLNNVCVKGLQVLEFATGVPQIRIRLPQSVRQSRGQIPDGQVGKQIDQDDGKQHARAGVAERVGRHYA